MYEWDQVVACLPVPGLFHLTCPPQVPPYSCKWFTFLFVWLKSTLLCLVFSLFAHAPWRFRLFLSLGFCDCCCKEHIGADVSRTLTSLPLGVHPSSRISKACCGFTFNYLRHFHMVFHNSNSNYLAYKSPTFYLAPFDVFFSTIHNCPIISVLPFHLRTLNFMYCIVFSHQLVCHRPL